MKRVFNLISLLLVTGMIFCSCTGCGGGQSGKDSKHQFDENDGPLVPYEETLKVTQVRYQNTSVTYARGEDKSDNFIRDFFKEKLNMEWESVWTTDYSSYFTKLNLDIAGNDLPDVFMVDGAQLQTLIENDQIEDLTDYYDYYASDRLKENIEYGDKMLLDFPTHEGKLYGVPLTSSYAGNTGFMWIRTDWMKKLGLSAPTTYQELCQYIDTLKKSGLCANNSSGFSFLGAGSVSFDSISQMYGAYYDYFVKDESTNKLIYSGITDNMKNALKAMQDMFKAGLIDSDWAAKGSTEEEMISVGQYGIVFGQYYYPGLLSGSLLNDSNADWEAYPLPALNADSKARPKGTDYVNGYVVVRKGYEHPEALLKSMNLWAELWTDGGEYNGWLTERMTTDHKTVKLIGEYALPYQFDGVLTFNSIGKSIREVLSSANPETEINNHVYSKMTFNYINDYLKDPKNTANISGEGWKLYKIYTSAAPVMDQYMGNLKFNEYHGMLSEDSAFNKVTLDKMMVECYTNIIMGDSIDTFDAFVKEWYKEGGQTMLDEVNQWYSSQS